MLLFDSKTGIRKFRFFVLDTVSSAKTIIFSSCWHLLDWDFCVWFHHLLTVSVNEWYLSVHISRFPRFGFHGFLLINLHRIPTHFPKDVCATGDFSNTFFLIFVLHKFWCLNAPPLWGIVWAFNTWMSFDLCIMYYAGCIYVGGFHC